MATTYPGIVDSFVNPSGTSTVGVIDHALQHTNENTAIIAVENTLGTTAGTSVLKNFAIGDFASRINSTNVPQQTSSNGTYNNSIVGTPTITGGTINNTTLGTSLTIGGSVNNANLGTPTITLGSDITGDMFFRSSGGILSKLGIGTAGQFVGNSNGTPAWALISALSIAIGTSNHDISGTGAQAVTFSPAFTPKLIYVSGNFHGGTSHAFSNGVTNGTNNFCQYADNSGSVSGSNDLIVAFNGNIGGGTDAFADIIAGTGFQSGTFNINWTKNSNPTGVYDFFYIILG